MRFITNAQWALLTELIFQQAQSSSLWLKLFLINQKELTEFLGNENENEEQLLQRLQIYHLILTPSFSIQQVLSNQNQISKSMKDKDSLSEYIFHWILGKGRFGRVYHVTHQGLKEDFAMKVLNKSFIFKKGLSQNILIEKNLLMI